MRDDWRRAAMSGDSAAIAALLAAGANADALDRYGQTALMLAAQRGHDAAVRVLLQSGADPDVTAKYGLSALMLAVVNHHAASARLLVDAGARLDLRGTGAAGFFEKTARQLAQDAGLADLADYIARAEGQAGGAQTPTTP